MRSTKATILNALAAILLLATGAVLVLYLLIALEPTSALNPFPPPTARPSPTATVAMTPTPMPTPTPFPTPMALRPATLTPTPESAFPFTATIEIGPVSETSDCRPMLVGVVLDREGHGMEGYPVHLWTTGAEMQNTDDWILFSDQSGRWQAPLPRDAYGLWYVQLHSPDARRVYPPLSAAIAVTLPETCPQAMVSFREQ